MSNIYSIIEKEVGKFGASIIIICAIAIIVILFLYLIPTINDKKNRKNDMKIDFSERHPKTYTVISVLVVLILGCLALWFLSSLVIWIGSGLGWLANEASKLDAVVIVALITGAVSIFSTIVAKIIDYRKRKSEYLAQKREQPYEDFLIMYYKIHDNTNHPGSYPEEEMIKDINKFSKGITLWGSKEVVSKWVQFRQTANSDENQDDIMTIIEELMNEMRKDMGTKRVKKGRLLALTINKESEEE